MATIEKLNLEIKEREEKIAGLQSRIEALSETRKEQTQITEKLEKFRKINHNYMRNVLKVEIYALELKYFKDNDAGMEILVPIVHGGKKATSTSASTL